MAIPLTTQSASTMAETERPQRAIVYATSCGVVWWAGPAVLFAAIFARRVRNKIGRDWPWVSLLNPDRCMYVVTPN